MAATLQVTVLVLIAGLSLGHLHTAEDGLSCSEEISELREKLGSQEETLRQQSVAITRLLEELQEERTTNKRQNDDIRNNAKLLESIQSKSNHGNTDVLDRDRKGMDSEFNVAFTAVLDGDIDNLGANDTIIFNKPLLNLGNQYSQYTGAFIAPVDGVYSFTFFIGCRGATQIYADLYVNDREVVSATAEGTHSMHDTQGGNSAIVQLLAGDAVQIKHHIWGSHVEAGNVGTVATSFSGFLIYPVESPPMNIIGK